MEMDKEMAINLLLKFMRKNPHLRSLNEIVNPFKKENPTFPSNYKISEMLEILRNCGVAEKTMDVRYNNVFYYTLINTDENFHLDLSQYLNQSSKIYITASPPNPISIPIKGIIKWLFAIIGTCGAIATIYEVFFK